MFSEAECNVFTVEARGYVRYLEQACILDGSNREVVINLLLDLQLTRVDVSLVQWVTLMVLYNQQECLILRVN